MRHSPRLPQNHLKKPGLTKARYWENLFPHPIKTSCAELTDVSKASNVEVKTDRHFASPETCNA
jgi:hypothetical protein